MANEIPPPPLSDIAAELEQLRAEEALRQERDQEDEDARELEELRLVKRLSVELGRRGVDFEVVNTQFGVFGVRKPDAQGIKQFDLCVGATPVSTIKLIGILRNYIVPQERMLDFHKIAQERTGIATGANSVAAAFTSLTGATRFEAKKKY